MKNEELDEINYDFFEDEFFGELDKWFTADIKCCSNCYDDFIKNWPITFEKITDAYDIEVTYFYENSRMNQLYSKEQYLNNLYRIECPRCLQSLKDIFWVFEFDFENFDELENDFNLLKESIRETPFLVLKNSLASKTFEILEDLSKSKDKFTIQNTLFRGRVISNKKVKKKDFLSPPKSITNEGRYNHLGIPVIYAADNKITCFNELRQPEQDLHIAEFSINKELRLLNLNDIDFAEGTDLLKAIVLSSLTSSKTDDSSKYKPEYYFTRFISDCCKFLKFDGIIYPSVQIGHGENYMLFDTDILCTKDIIKIERYS